jgi:Ca2+-binding EF-hand superfamily protein
MVDAFATITREEGFIALFRVSTMSILRAMIASGANLVFYLTFREYLLFHNFLPDSPITDAVVCLVSSAITAVAMNPVDMLRTRLFNEHVDPITHKGTYYKNGIDALIKVIKNEGVIALWKGTITSFLRLGPHFTLTFVLLEEMKRLSLMKQRFSYDKRITEKLDNLFNKYDLDHNKVLDKLELQAMMTELVPRSEESFLSDHQYQQLIKKDVEKIIAVADENKDGVIQLDEFKKVVCNAKRVVHEHELEAAFMYFDRDGNGVIDQDEMIFAFKSLFPRAGKDANLMDAEYEEQLRKDVQKILKYVDVNESGCIEYDEFVRIADKIPKLQVKRFIQTLITESGIATVY